MVHIIIVFVVGFVNADLQLRSSASPRTRPFGFADTGSSRVNRQCVRALDHGALDVFVATLAALPTNAATAKGTTFLSLWSHDLTPATFPHFSFLSPSAAHRSLFGGITEAYQQLFSVLKCGATSCPPPSLLEAAKEEMISKVLHVYAELVNIWKCGAASCPATTPVEAVEQALVNVQRTSYEAASQVYYAALNIIDCGAVSCPKPSPLAMASMAYIERLHTHYFQTTAMQALILVGLGDVISQAIEIRAARGQQEYDPVRTLRLSSLGLLIGGFGTSSWLRFLEQELPGSGSPDLIVKKASLDAVVWAPIANTLYLTLTPLLAGESVSTVQKLLAKEFVSVMRAELSTFFPYNIVSFSLIPPLVRPFTTGFVSMCFAVYISYTTNNLDNKADADGEVLVDDRPTVVPALSGIGDAIVSVEKQPQLNEHAVTRLDSSQTRGMDNMSIVYS